MTLWFLAARCSPDPRISSARSVSGVSLPAASIIGPCSAGGVVLVNVRGGATGVVRISGPLDAGGAVSGLGGAAGGGLYLGLGDAAGPVLRGRGMAGGVGLRHGVVVGVGVQAGHGGAGGAGCGVLVEEPAVGGAV